MNHRRERETASTPRDPVDRLFLSGHAGCAVQIRHLKKAGQPNEAELDVEGAESDGSTRG
jgi:hypothetical protein